MTDWPNVPRPGEFVRLPLDLPDGYQRVLLAAIGCGGDAVHVGLDWALDHSRVEWFDGDFGVSGDPGPWRAFADHPTIARLLRPYEEARDAGLELTLLVNRRESTVLVGHTAEVSSLIHSQPSALKAEQARRGGGDEAMLDAILARLLPQQADAAERARRRDLRSELGVGLVRWLDADQR
jgi:hypothetical protein